ncbi:hypothetical protein Lalb_Chr11g0070811 [Lupinus albus]|uniref:DUF4218 domain-containing protein n=1 Tax=Lupinus albus TaxID=3870 RepID=A0A6A4PRT5_LUPAL|nr:hypothetical protein Lalb_Chr11g0070811 [Lupinus albus]
MFELEMYFTRSFFGIMVHLSIHLVREIQLCGPCYMRWMYPFERYMKTLKGYVKNRSRPEGCIVERYIVEVNWGNHTCMFYIMLTRLSHMLKDT